MNKKIIGGSLLLLSLSATALAHTERGPWLFKYRGTISGSYCTCTHTAQGVVPIKNNRYNRESPWYRIADGVAFSDYNTCYQFLDDFHSRYGCGFLHK